MKRAKRKKFTLFRLPGDPAERVRKLMQARLIKARAYLDKHYGQGGYTILDKEAP